MTGSIQYLHTINYEKVVKKIGPMAKVLIVFFIYLLFLLEWNKGNENQVKLKYNLINRINKLIIDEYVFEHK